MGQAHSPFRCHQLSWSNDVKKCFVNKLNLLKRSLFLGRESVLDLYFKVIVSLILYGRIAWSSSVNVEQLKSDRQEISTIEWQELKNRFPSFFVHK